MNKQTKKNAKLSVIPLTITILIREVIQCKFSEWNNI